MIFFRNLKKNESSISRIVLKKLKWHSILAKLFVLAKIKTGHIGWKNC